jgi:AbrB family looped-hinge helix DNA binding protein
MALLPDKTRLYGRRPAKNIAEPSHIERPAVPSATVAATTVTWHHVSMDATLVMGRQGRIVIPVEMRDRLGLAPGDRLHLHLAGGRLVLERPRDAVADLRRIGRAVPRERSLVDELLAERRAAAAAE